MIAGRPSGPIERRRPRAWARGAAMFLLAGLLAFVGAFLANYQPLSARAGGASASPDGNFVECAVGSLFRYGFTIGNQGPVGVTVRRIGGTEVDPIAITDVRMAAVENPPVYSAAPDYGVPFQPFSLAPDRFRYVVVTAEIRRCMSGRFGRYILSSSEVGFSVMGVGRTTALPLPYTIQVGRT